MQVRVLVTGSRDCRDRQGVGRMLDHAAALYPEARPEDFLLIHGDCRRYRQGRLDLDRSADQLADQEARRRGWDVLPCPADYDLYGPQEAPKIRNAEMVDGDGRPEMVPHLCLSMPGGSGTGHCTSLARKAGIRVVRLADLEA